MKKPYNPGKCSNKQLANDWRLICAHYSRLRNPKKKSGYAKQEILDLAEQVMKEIRTRVLKSEMIYIFHPAKMKKSSKELYEKTKKKLGTTFSTLPVYPGNQSKEGTPVDLRQILGGLDDFYLIEDFVTITGSIVNWGKTTGDIDILIKASPESDIFQLVKWRFERAYPDLADRFHFTEYGVWRGPFTDHIHLLDLKVELSPDHIYTHLMSKKHPAFTEQADKSKKEDKVELMRPCYLLKPIHGRTKQEVYTPDAVLAVMNKIWPDWKDSGAYVEKKHDGVHCAVHKKGNEILIISEDGQDYTANCPTLVKQFREQNGDFVVAGEVELWSEEAHQPRATTAGVLNSKEVNPEEKNLRINLFDILYST